MAKTKLLFVCTANINRSRAAEDLFANSDQYEARSAGLEFVRLYGEEVTGQVLDQSHIDWADKIFVMDEKNDRHYTRLIERFNVDVKKVHNLDVPDIYSRGDKFLIKLLKSHLADFGISVS